jgi:hypothetical protein
LLILAIQREGNRLFAADLRPLGLTPPPAEAVRAVDETLAPLRAFASAFPAGQAVARNAAAERACGPAGERRRLRHRGRGERGLSTPAHRRYRTGVKRVVRSWGRNSLTALAVALSGFAALVCVAGALGDHPARWLAVLGGLVVAIDVLASLALAVRALVMDVSSRPLGLRVRGLLGTRTYPWASIVGVGTEEGLIASTGPYDLPVVEVNESGGRRRVRLWMLARSLNRPLAPTIEQLEAMIASAHGPRPEGLTARDVVTPEE